MTWTRPLRLTALAALAASLAFDATATSPQEIWEALQAPRLDPARAVRVEALEIDMGPGGFRLEEGVIVPAVPVAGRKMEMVFLGRASFRMNPPDAIEEGQLELFTGSTALDVAVDQVVLVAASEEVAAKLLQRKVPASLDPELAGRAERAFASWAESAERKGFGAEGAMLKAAVGDARLRAYFAAQIHSAELGEFYYVLDPSSIEQVTLGQFVPIDADYLEEGRIRKELKRQQRKGRLSQLRFDDLGDWDTWVATSLTDAAGEKRPGSCGFESEHYELNVKVSPKEQRVYGRSRMRVRAERDGLRVATLGVAQDVKVTSVRDASGRSLPTFRSRGDCHVVLAEPTVADQSFTLDIEFGGLVLEELDPGIYELQNTFAWYPRLGDLDRATYDVTLRWPKRVELLAGGHRVDGGEDADGYLWERRKLELPAIAFSFEIGDFDVHHASAGHVELTVGFSKAAGTFDDGAKEEVIATLRDALAFYEERFGAYPLDHLTVATVPRGFSQGFLSFLTLSQFLIWTPDRMRPYFIAYDSLGSFDERRKDARMETISHELAHQWWGNRVGWYSYRDQWLSEALADFSATWFTAKTSEHAAVYLARHATRWQQDVMAETREGRIVESLGPVVLGTRLASSKSAGAYSAIVYDKGSVVFFMLERCLGDAPFTEMLHELAKAVNNRVIDTATFLRAIEKMSGADLTRFAEQFIYGTGIPEIHYTYEFKQEASGWVIEGEAEQIARASYRVRLLRTEKDTWDISRVRVQGNDVTGMPLVVPFQMSLAGAADTPADGKPLSRSKVKLQKGLGGSLTLQGERTQFRIPVTERPQGFWLDQRGEVLAMFADEKRHRKLALKRKADTLAEAERFEEAESFFRQAIEAELVRDPEIHKWLDKKDLEKIARRTDVQIHLGLADLYLQLGRDTAAAEELKTAEGLLTRLEERYYLDLRLVLGARLALRAGDYEAAFALLSKNLRLDFPVQKDDTLADVARRQKFRSGRRMRLGGDAYAMLAVAAHETGHPDVAAQAKKEAERRGAEIDLSAKGRS